MKKVFSIFAVICISILFTECKKETVTPSNPNSVVAFSGSWRLSSFIKDNVDITAQFDNCTIVCNSNGSLIIHDHGNSYSCTWNYQDNDHSICHFNISGCDEGSALWECDDDWVLTSQNANSCIFNNQNTHHNSIMCWTRL